MQRLSQYINAEIRVSSSVLFGDGIARLCRLDSVEDMGVWIVNDELAARVFDSPDPELWQSVSVPVFVPYEQIECIAPGQVPASRALTARLQQRPLRARKAADAPPIASKKAAPESKRKK